MNKTEILQEIIARLTAGAELYQRAARAAQFEATDEQSKAENKYDTRGLEASYLARGQSRQAAETEQALQDFRALAGRTFAPDSAIELGALVELKGRRDRMLLYVGPSMGGTEVLVDGEEITVITPHSPLGQQLVGTKTGAKIKLPSGEERRVGSVQ
ncbi:MAG: transcription elongation factor GreAB [Verrucomicrobiales bacterium]|nr:transcription elongation factor GreAB [Verrucomicrobiales bacterium]